MKDENLVKIAVFGIGYVGLSNAILLSQNNHVVMIDVIQEKIDMVNKRVSPFVDNEIIDYFSNKKLDLTATLDWKMACKNAEFVLIATPTNYDPKKNYFDTHSVEDSIEKILSINKAAYIVVKSTVPIGYTNHLRNKYRTSNILFSPEFLREGKALYDNLYPSRIVVGTSKNNLRVLDAAQKFVFLLQNGAIKKNIPSLFMSSTEAEAVKLFANTYLAARISFFNELDTYSQDNGLDSSRIIEGVCLDPRIGKNYNNPSFGYGGYCLPKDTKQLLAEYKMLPQAMISAIVESNILRKKFIVDKIHKFAMGYGEGEKTVVGIYRLTMKANSDNFRQACIIDIIDLLKDRKMNILIYEPRFKYKDFNGLKVMGNLDEFKNKATIIVANRFADELNDVQEKVFTRDIYREN